PETKDSISHRGKALREIAPKIAPSLKFVADLFFVGSFIGFAKQPRVLWMIPVYFMLYPFYNLAALFMIPTKGYEWKGRSYNS
ncbi:MAG: hypothetical protein ACKOYC_05685, partial [Bacteroidota bacterium]